MTKASEQLVQDVLAVVKGVNDLHAVELVKVVEALGEKLRPAETASTMFLLNQANAQQLLADNRRTSNGMRYVYGCWPGDETDEEVLRTLAELG